MSRKHKKRNKPYTGADAVPDKPVVRRYVAVERSPLSEWWQPRKKFVKPIAIATGGVALAGYLLFELIRLVF